MCRFLGSATGHTHTHKMHVFWRELSTVEKLQEGKNVFPDEQVSIASSFSHSAVCPQISSPAY